MTSPVIPPVGPNWAIWARQLSGYLARVRAKLQWKSTGEAASENGVILWDDASKYPVVSNGGAFTQVALFGSVPASASATGTAGQMAWDADYVYVCTATDTWVRTPLSTWPGGGASVAATLEIPWHSNAGGTLALTNSPLAARVALNQPTRMIKMVPLDGHTQVRMTGVQVTTSASANTPLLRLRYKTGAYSTTVGDYLQIGASAECEFTLTGTGARDTGWIDLAALVTGDVQCALIELGGDGVADPAMGHVQVFFR